jgi:hypothetical protein
MGSVLLGPQVLAAVEEPREDLSGLVTDIAPLAGVIDRMSCLMLAQLAVGYRHRMFGVHHVLDIIRMIEGSDPLRRSARTKVGAPFKHPPLRGLHHWHWFEPVFLDANLYAEFGGQQGGNAKLDAAIRAGEAGRTPEEQASLIAHNVVVGGYESRSQRRRLTGEWIVYREDPTGNDYLLLATHVEGNENIANAIRTHCESRFVNAIEGW